MSATSPSARVPRQPALDLPRDRSSRARMAARRAAGPARRARHAAAASAALHDALEARDTARLLAEVREALATDTVDAYARDFTVTGYR